MIDVVVIGAGLSGLTAARTLSAYGITPVVLESGPEPVGSWPDYYDSLTLFSPAGFGMPGQENSPVTPTTIRSPGPGA